MVIVEEIRKEPDTSGNKNREYADLEWKPWFSRKTAQRSATNQNQEQESTVHQLPGHNERKNPDEAGDSDKRVT